MRKPVFLTILAFGSYGLSRIAFNYAAIHGVGPVFVGQVNTLMSLITIILALVGQPIAATLSRFVPRYIAEGRTSAAGVLVGWSCLITCGITAILYLILLVLVPRMKAFNALGDSRWYLVASIYVFGYAFYFLFKMAYFAYGRIRMYVRAELSAVGVFWVALCLAYRAHDPIWFSLAVVLHPTIFSAIAMWDLRGSYAWTGADVRWGAVRGEYLTYATLWLAASASGLAAYHGSIVVLTATGSNASSVGVYALCLSLIAPLNVLPSILSQVMFPRFAANAAVNAPRANAMLIRDVTSILVVFLIVGLAVICGCTSVILRSLGVPSSPEWIAVVQLLAIGTSVSLLSTPSGNFLFADSYARTSTVIGLSSLGIGGIVWWMSVARMGAVGAAAGYAVLMTVRGMSNMIVANQYARWQVGFQWKWLVAGATLCLLCVGAYTPLSGSLRITLVGCVVFGMLLLFTGELRRAMTDMASQFTQPVEGHGVD